MGDNETVRKSALASGEIREVRNRYGVTFGAGCYVSRSGGWHGDGTDVSAYTFPPSESEILIAALRRTHDALEWSEIRGVPGTPLGDVWQLLPAGFLPPNPPTLVVGRPLTESSNIYYYVDRTNGLFYVAVFRT